MMADTPRESLFEWDDRKREAAILLAQGYLIKETAKAVGVNEKTIDRWKRDTEFSQEVDRLSLMLDVAARAERVRIAIRAVRSKTKGSVVRTRKDLLDWLKYVQSETDGVKLDLTALLDARTQVAGSRQTGTVEPGKGDSGATAEPSTSAKTTG